MWASHSVRSSRRPLLLAFGPAGTMFALIPAAILVVVLFVELPRMRTFAPATMWANVVLIGIAGVLAIVLGLVSQRANRAAFAG